MNRRGNVSGWLIAGIIAAVYLLIGFSLLVAHRLPDAEYCVEDRGYEVYAGAGFTVLWPFTDFGRPPGFVWPQPFNSACEVSP